MPELPEVEVVRAGLQGVLEGATLSEPLITSSRVARRLPAGATHLAVALDGAEVLEVDRRGKFMWWVLHQPSHSPALFSVVVHLGMSGQMLVTPPDTAAPPHSAVSVRVSRDGEERLLRFVDQRTFGSMTVAPLVEDPWSSDGSGHRFGIPALATHIAPDPLEPAWSSDTVVARARRRRAAVKSLLLDQGLLSGVGNIYADEALWLSSVHPATAGCMMSETQWSTLLSHAAEVMRLALAQGGTSFDALYVNVNGASGYFDRSLCAYGRTGQPCHRCTTALERVVIGGRSSHFCPSCQQPPRRRPGSGRSA